MAKKRSTTTAPRAGAATSPPAAATDKPKISRPRRPLLDQIIERAAKFRDDLRIVKSWRRDETTVDADSTLGGLTELEKGLATLKAQNFEPPKATRSSGPDWIEEVTVLRMKADTRAKYPQFTAAQLDSILFLWLDPLHPKTAAVRLAGLQCSMSVKHLELAPTATDQAAPPANETAEAAE